ncbi:MAG: GGDEF domain-containing protein [Thermosulfidibacteraceae bacterium]|jgi:diguanylate cyclase
MIIEKNDLIRAFEFVKEVEKETTSKKEKALILAEATKKALGQLSELNLAITPDRFQIWFYAFLTLILKGIFNPTEDDIIRSYLLAFGELKGKKELTPTAIEKELVAKEVEETLDLSKVVLQDAIHMVEKYSKNLIERESNLNTIKTLTDLNATITLLIEEIRILQETNRELKKELNKSIKKVEVLKERIRSLYERSTKDPLTNLLNRAKFEMTIDKLIKNYREDRIKCFCIALMDIDNFKKLNDLYGHVVGDEFLRRCAEVIVKELRSCDLPFRYGGEEFAVIIVDTRIKEAVAVCERLRRNIEEIRISTEIGNAKTTISIGIAEATKEDSPKSLIERADKALYLAKRDGKNCIRTEKDLTARL